MEKDCLRGSFFPESQALITGGSFTIQNFDNSRVYTREKGGYSQLRDAVAPNALHDSGHVFDPPKCYPGTRVAIVQAIMDWLAGVHEDTRDKGVMWLTGGAGAGKSAIGRTVCERCAEERTLLASFFFSSGDSTRNHSKALVATIAYQICAIDPGIRNTVANYIDIDPHIFSRSLRTQFISLVLEPVLLFHASKSHSPRHLVVIDGLDECMDKSSQRDVLETITYLITTYPRSPIRFLVCSRPENTIKNVIHGADMYPRVFTVSLSDDCAASEDIELYLRDNFNAIRQSHTFRHLLPGIWPTEDNISELTDNSSGQFIYVSTAMKYIQSPDDMPHRRLEVILGLRPSHGDLPFAQLDALYTYVLTTTKDPPIAAKISAFVERYPNTCIPFISRYLQLEDEQVEIILSQLAAIIAKMRHDYDVYDNFSLMHKSFGDFLSDQSRSKELYVNVQDALLSDILLSIQIFSEPSDYCRFHPDFFSHSEFPLSFCIQALGCEKWFSHQSSALRVDVINAVLKFPIESFCNEFFSCHDVVCREHEFTCFLFKIILKFKNHHPILEDTYNTYMAVLSKCAIQHLPTDVGPESLGINFQFAIEFIKPSQKYLWVAPDRWAWNVFYPILGDQCAESEDIEYDVGFELINTFQHFLTRADHLRIFSRAALFCLQFLCDISITKSEAERHLKVVGMEKKRRNSRPWRWHRNISVHKIPINENRHVLFEYHMAHFSPSYAVLPKLMIFFPVDIYSFASFDWKYSQGSSQQWNTYLTHLQYLPEILPLAGRYPPLIDLCKTKAFAPLSMMFPAVSRRARRAIAKYLERMESEDDADMESQDDRNPEESEEAEPNDDNSSRHYK